VLVIQTGSTHPEVVARHGDYDQWFFRHLEELGVEPLVVRAHRGERWPEVPRVQGLLLTGSPLSVRDEAPWMAELGRWALSQADAGLPVLAVCFGHQLLGEALGGRVEENPAGGEYGTIEVQLSEEGQKDPLFAGLPERIAVQSTHRDILISTPPGLVCLGSTANTTWQGWAWGPRLRAVQFHPEMADHHLRDLMAARGIPGEVRPSPHGRRILQNWLQGWVLSASSGGPVDPDAPPSPPRPSLCS
jgi:GMP synthase (glutamine-hydrolysing)